MAAQYHVWHGGEWVLHELDPSEPRCIRHECRLVEVEAHYVCPACSLARWTEVLHVALPSVPRGESLCEAHGPRVRLRDREVCPSCLLADVRAVLGGDLGGAVEQGRVVLRAPGRRSCTRHGMPLGNDGRSFTCLWCLPFLAAATARGGQVHRPGDGTPLGAAMELTNELAVATADRKWRTIEVDLDPTVPPHVDLPGAGDDPDHLVALSLTTTPEGDDPAALLIRQLATATEPS